MWKHRRLLSCRTVTPRTRSLLPRFEYRRISGLSWPTASTTGLTSAFVAGYVRERQSFKVKLILTGGRHSKMVVRTLALILSRFPLLFGVRPEEFRIHH